MDTSTPLKAKNGSSSGSESGFVGAGEPVIAFTPASVSCQRVKVKFQPALLRAHERLQSDEIQPDMSEEAFTAQERAEDMKLHRQLKEELLAAKFDVKKSLNTLRQGQALFKLQFRHLQAALEDHSSKVKDSAKEI